MSHVEESWFFSTPVRSDRAPEIHTTHLHIVHLLWMDNAPAKVCMDYRWRVEVKNQGASGRHHNYKIVQFIYFSKPIIVRIIIVFPYLEYWIGLIESLLVNKLLGNYFCERTTIYRKSEDRGWEAIPRKACVSRNAGDILSVFCLTERLRYFNCLLGCRLK